MSLAQERCFNHNLREAVARCRDCGRFFCRECISEYDDRMVCAYCLKKAVSGPKRRRPLRGFVRIFQIALGVMILWTSFYLLGKILLAIPSSFHEAAVTEAPERESK